MKRLVTLGIAFSLSALVAVWTTHANEEHKHGHAEHGATSIQGEVIDVFCYVGHEAKGAGHANCARKCIESGLPAGILTADGKVYLATGDHVPMAKELAAHAAKQVKVTGKLSSRGGVNLIEIEKLESVK